MRVRIVVVELGLHDVANDLLELGKLPGGETTLQTSQLRMFVLEMTSL